MEKGKAKTTQSPSYKPLHVCRGDQGQRLMGPGGGPGPDDILAGRTPAATGCCAHTMAAFPRPEGLEGRADERGRRKGGKSRSSQAVLASPPFPISLPRPGQEVPRRSMVVARRRQPSSRRARQQASAPPRHTLSGSCYSWVVPA